MPAIGSRDSSMSVKYITENMMLEGGCTCRDVRYRLSSRPLFVHCCHCRWCQREAGSAFALNAMIEADRVELLSGNPVANTIPTASGDGLKVTRCPTCLTAIWCNYAGAGDLIHFVKVGTLDDPDQVPPDIHIFTMSKQPWVQLSPDLPAYDAFYDRDTVWPEDSLARRAAVLKQSGS